METCLRRFSLIPASLFALLLVSACGPEKRVLWSPDGTHVAIVSNQKLYVSDSKGKLAGPLAGDVGRVCWMPDSRRLVVVSKEQIDTWQELGEAAPLEFDGKRIISATIAAGEELKSWSRKLDDFKPSNSAQLTLQQWMAGLLFLKQQSDAGLKEKLGEDWKEIAEARVDVYSVGVLPVLPGNSRPITLFRSLNEIDEVRTSPDGAAVVVVNSWNTQWGESEESSLLVARTDTRARPLLVADHVARFPDWSADGRSLVFVRQPGADGLGRVALRTVRDQNGTYLAELPEIRDLALVAFSRSLTVRCLRDGRIFFAATEIALPAGTREISRQPTLFSLDPSGSVSISRLLPGGLESRLPERADLFELSPDETSVAIPGNKGRVSVVKLSTGEVAEVAPSGPDDLQTVPVWRSNGELSLVVRAGAPGGSPGRPELILWSPQRATAISVAWPDEIVAGIK